MLPNHYCTNEECGHTTLVQTEECRNTTLVQIEEDGCIALEQIEEGDRTCEEI